LNPVTKIVVAFEIIACITAWLKYAQLRKTYWAAFPFYLSFIVLSEFAGYFLKELFPKHPEYNTHYYGYFEIPVEFLFFFFVFYMAIPKRANRLLIVICTVIYLLVWLAEIKYVAENVNSFYSLSYTMGNLLLLILILMFFINLATSNEIVHFRENMLFWVSLGLMIFYLGSFPFYGLFDVMIKKHEQLMERYYYVVYGLNSLMYLMFTCSFIWGKPDIK